MKYIGKYLSEEILLTRECITIAIVVIKELGHQVVFLAFT
jgi:hypothetical protein